MKSAPSPAATQALPGALLPGETLTYDISWSRLVKAGTLVMTIREERLASGKEALRFTATARSAGVLDRVYPIDDKIESVFDPGTMESLSYSLSESHGKRRKKRLLVFDHSARTVTSTENDNPPETAPAPEQVQDALSLIYFLRAAPDLAPGKTLFINVFDSGKNWSDEVRVEGREKVATPAGEFETLRVRTRPHFEGNFLNKGEVFFWLTDDSSRVPVKIMSTLSVGSVLSVLAERKPGAGPR